MNVVTLIGNMVREPDLRYTQSGKAVLKFTLAVNRMKRDEADFINCIAWEKAAELIATYVTKGKPLAVSGRIQTGSYEDKTGRRVYTTDVIVNDFQFLGRKEAEPTRIEEVKGFAGMTMIDDSGIPF